MRLSDKRKFEMHILFRVDGGPEIGYGHLIRSSALAEEISMQGHTVTVGTTTPASVRAVFPNTVDIVDLPSRGDPKPFVTWLITAKPDVVFTDAYPVDTAYQQAIREHVPLAVLQDDTRHAVCADLFVNGNLYAGDLDNEFVGQPPQTCLGPDYVLLRGDLRERAAETPPWRDPPERAIIMMGGSDVAELTPTIVRAFDDFDLRVDAIVGPGCSADHQQAVRNAATESPADVRVARDPADLVERMRQADFGVSTASSATYEHLALGTPLISIPVVDNQKPIAAALRDRDAAIVLQRDANQTVIHDAVATYLTDAGLRRRRQKQGREIVDGNGVRRLVAEVLSIGESNPCL